MENFFTHLSFAFKTSRTKSTYKTVVDPFQFLVSMTDKEDDLDFNDSYDDISSSEEDMLFNKMRLMELS